MTEDRGVGLKAWLSGPKSRNLKADARAQQLVHMDKHRIIVLPLANISSDPRDEYFADGLTEELISSISNISELSVISRTSAMTYKGTSKKVGAIGKELDVGSVLEGSVRKSGNKMRIAVQLIDAKDDKHLWAQNYDREFDDVFAVQSDIAKQVADALRVRILPGETRRIEKKPTNSSEAYGLYLKGRYFWNKRTKEALLKATQYFTEATKKDPNFSRAYVGLADCYIIMENWGYLTTAEASTKSKMYVTKALELDDSVAEAHVSRASILMAEEWDVEGAEREFKRAIELNPSYATAHHWYANGLLAPQGRFEEAISELREAERLDPLSPMISANLGDQLLHGGLLKEAQDQYRNVIESSPDFAYVYSRLGLALLKESRYDEAISEIKKTIDLPGNWEGAAPDLIYAYSSAGRKEEAQRLLAELQLKSTRQFIPNILLALANAAAGDNEKAIEFLLKALAEKSNQLRPNINEPHFDQLRSDPRFKDLLKTIGIRVRNDIPPSV